MVAPEALTTTLGIVGGVTLSLCTLPQLIQIWKTKSARDVSLQFTVMYFVGLTCTVAYMGLIEAWAAFFPASFECFLAVLMIISKVIMDKRAAKLPPVPDKQVVEVIIDPKDGQVRDFEEIQRPTQEDGPELQELVQHQESVESSDVHIAEDKPRDA
jgi:MtN3 and saliva related transmembrane protein